MRSEAELREASGYAGRPRDFDDLIRILDPELRLITPTDPEGLERTRIAAAVGGRTEPAATISSPTTTSSPRSATG